MNVNVQKSGFVVFAFAVVLISVILSSCASGSALVTGRQREAVSADEVRIYAEMPQDCEVIGIVSASSDAGWTIQGCADYAVAELKEQAAKIGANAVVIETTEQDSLMGAVNVSGKAVYVPSGNASVD